MLKIEELTPEDEYLYQDYVAESRNTTFYHTIGWRNVIQHALGHKPYYLVAKDNNKIKGILPLFLVKSLFFGRYLSSLPAANYCGICADEEYIRNALLERAKKIIKELDLDYFELRDLEDNDYNPKKDLSHVTFLISLDSNPEIVWSRLKKNVKRNIKKAIDLGLTAYWNKCEIEDFYKIYIHNMKRLGSPAYSQQFFKTILDEFPNNTHLISVEYRKKTIACDLLTTFKDRLLSLLSGTYKKYFNLHPNNFICWEEIKYGCQNHYKYFDFGRSQWNSGSFNFKKSWNGRICQLYYCYYLNRTTHIPIRNPNHSKYRCYIKIWKRLPIFISRRLGHRIVKYLN